MLSNCYIWPWKLVYTVFNKTITMKQLITSFLLFFFFLSGAYLNATPFLPLNDNAIAPDFTVTDINGVSHTLYDYLDDGKMVILDFSATWCPPCWSYHQAGVLKSIYNNYGPSGTDEIMVLFIEADPSTPVSALYGSGNTQGDWVTGTPYPIIDDGNGSLNSAYAISFFPTLYAVCSDRKVYEVGATSVNGWLNRLESCGLDGSVVADDVSCFGDSDGSIDLTATGGFGDVNYSWNTGDNSEDVDNLSSGNYAVTISDAFNRQVVLDNISISSPSIVTANANVIQSVTCNGSSDGSASVSASGGNGGFSYSWSNGETGPVATNLSAGVYNVTATDSKGCEDSDVLIISQPAAVSSAPSIIPENCGNSDGFLFVNAQGGTTPYTYDFGDGQTSNPILSGISAGTYSVTVTDLFGCTYSDSYVVPEVPAPVATVANPLDLDCTNDIIVLDASASSSGVEFTYQWSTTDGNILSGANTLTPEVDEAGTYQLEIFNITNACIGTTSVEVISNLNLPSADAGSGGTIDCVNSLITLNGVGSQGPEFTYLWTTGDGNIISDPTLLEVEVDAAGVYTLEVLNNSNGCSVVSETEVFGDFDLPVVEIADAPQIDCSNSSVVLDATGTDTGTDFSYLWSTSDGNIVSGAATLNPEVDQAGTYILEVANASNGCSSTLAVTVVSDGELPVADAGNGGELNCVVESLTLMASSSSDSNIVYEWTDELGTIMSTDLEVNIDLPGIYTFVATDLSNGCSNQSSTEVTENITEPMSEAGPGMEYICSTNSLILDGSNSDQGASISYNWSTNDGVIVAGADGVNPEVSSPGTYILTVTNADNGCTAIDEVFVEDNTVEPEIIASTVGQLDCDNTLMSIDASESNTNGTMVFTWSTTDGQIISGTNEPILEIGLPSTYSLVITNTDNDCSSQEDFVIEGFIPVELELVDSQNPLCHNSNDGSASVEVAGGDGDFTYLWSDGSTESTNSNLGQGFHTVTVTDGNNCTDEVDVEIIAPAEILLVGVATDETSSDANDGTVEVIVSGGTGTYTYLWSTDDTTSEISNLEPGEYTVVVSDENGCTNEISVDVNAFGCNVSADVLGSDISCNGMNDGSATVDFEGGDILSVEWSNGETGLTISDLEPGTYSVLVIDVDNCPAEANIEIVEPAVITTEVVDSGGLLCPGDEDGYFILEGFGGTGELSPQWSNGSTEWGIYGISGGEEYSLTITDENQCSESMIIVANEPSSMITSSDVVDVSCFGMNDGSIFADVVGGTSPYIYEWSTGENYEMIFGLEAGVYSLDITDANGCVVTNEYTVEEPTELAVELIEIQASSDSNPTGSVSVNTSGGVEPYTFAWYLDNELVSTEEDLENVGPGSYELTVIDANGCENNSGPHVVELGVSVDEHIYDFSMDVYPNPSNGLFYLEISDLKSSDKMQIELLDLTGKKLSQTVLSGSTNYMEKLDLITEASGVYFLKVVMSDQVKLIRLINK
jgi:thiol-disulfide isomerase/thioredoxin